jgi:hypothetical protein
MDLIRYPVPITMFTLRADLKGSGETKRHFQLGNQLTRLSLCEPLLALLPHGLVAGIRCLE